MPFEWGTSLLSLCVLEPFLHNRQSWLVIGDRKCLRIASETAPHQMSRASNFELWTSQTGFPPMSFAPNRDGLSRATNQRQRAFPSRFLLTRACAEQDLRGAG